MVANQVQDPSEIFEEALSHTAHPPTILIENSSLYDTNGDKDPGRLLKASTLRKLASINRPSLLAVPRVS